MKTLLDNPDIAPQREDYQAIVRRAHQERSDALRGILTALVHWRRKDRRDAPADSVALKLAGCH
jgi:hypothetical protein